MQDVANRFFPLEEHALSIAASRCQNAAEMDWLRDVIELAEDDIRYKGSIYAIPYNNGTVILHQPWTSSCVGCLVYNCEGDSLTLSESQKIAIVADANEENIIYTSSR